MLKSGGLNLGTNQMKAFASKWKWVGSILCFSLVILFSRQFLIFKGFEFFIHHTFTSLTRQNLTFSSLSHDKEHWIMDNPQLLDEKHSDIDFNASKAILNYTIDLWKREINLYITLKDPEFRMNTPVFSQWLNKIQSQNGFFTFTTHVSIQKGLLNLNGQEYTIQTELHIGPSFQGNLGIDFNDTSYFKTQFLRNSSSEWQMDFECQEVECLHLHHIVTHIIPSLNNLKIEKGIVHGIGGINLRKEYPPLIYGEGYLAHFNFQYVPLCLGVCLGNVQFNLQRHLGGKGSIVIDGNENVETQKNLNVQHGIRNIKGDILLDDAAKAKIALHAIYEGVDQLYDLLVDAQASLPLQKYATLNLNWNLENPRQIGQTVYAKNDDEMHGSLNIPEEGNSKLTLFLKGNLNSFLHYVSDNHLRQKLSQTFDRHSFIIQADLKNHGDDVELVGLAKIIDAKGEEKSAGFGFEFSNSLSISQTSFRSPSFPFFKVEIKNGWFHALDLPLETYLAPFFTDETLIKLSGRGDFHGYFNNQILMTTYQVQDVILENDILNIKVDDSLDDTFCHAIPVHYFNFNDHSSFGSLHILNGSYLEKRNNLLFTGIHADILFDGKNICIPTLESFSNGIYMSGNLDINLSNLDKDCLDLDVHIQTLHGKVTQVQSFFSHFCKTLFFLKIPIDGDVILHQDGCHLHFFFTPDRCDMKAFLKGSLVDGTIANHSNVALHELSLNFEYDHQSHLLDFSEIHGTLLVGEPERFEEYHLVGERVYFPDYAQNRASFDVWIGDKKRDMIRLVGETYASQACPGSECVQFVLDQNLSHFGNVHPQFFHLILKDWCRIHEFRMVADFKLSSLFQDLQRFSRTGLLFLSRHALKQLNDIKKASGNFKMEIAYDDTTSELDYHLLGEAIVIDSYAFNNIVLDGKKCNDIWVIDQFTMDNISIAADLLHKSGSWLINFLGIKIGTSVLVGLQGEYFEDSRIVDGKINLLEIHSDAFEEWFKASEFLKKCSFKGFVRGSGSFHYELSSNGIRFGKLDAQLKTSITNCEFKGIHFDDLNNVCMHYSTEKGLAIDKVNIALKSQEDRSKKAHLTLDKFIYDLKQDVISLKNLDFVISSAHIQELINHLSQCFPELFSTEIVTMINQSKHHGDLAGTLHLDFAYPHFAIQLALKEGEFHFLNKKFVLSQFILDYDPVEVKIVTQCLGFPKPFWVQYQSTRPNEFAISENAIADLQNKPLIIKWQNHPDQGFLIREMKGQFNGMTFLLSNDLHSETIGNSHFLKGEIRFDQQSLTLVLPKIDDKLTASHQDSGLCLKGEWEFCPSKEPNELIKICFLGQLDGQNFEFKGYQFDHLIADMQLSPDRIFLNNIHITDSCGDLRIAEIFLNKGRNDTWKFVLGNGDARDVRPAMMRRAVIEKISRSPISKVDDWRDSLLIREFTLTHLQGVIGNAESFVGEGSFMFVNPPQKNSSGSFLTIPGEIISQLGLDFSVLNPVIGTVFYEIKDGKFFLNKLKDVYSQGKMSKFYLTSYQKSYVDFDGNLNIQVKMKQNNVFFKLAEFFFLTINGTLQKPHFLLEKQKK